MKSSAILKKLRDSKNHRESQNSTTLGKKFPSKLNNVELTKNTQLLEM